MIAGFSLQQILTYRFSSNSLPHCIHHQGPDCWLEAILQRIASSLLQEQCYDNGGLLSSNPPGLVSVLLLGQKGSVGLFSDCGLFGQVGHGFMKRRWADVQVAAV